VIIGIDEARSLVQRAMEALEHDTSDAGLIADHLMDCELRGLAYGGLPRAVSIVERLERSGNARTPVAVVHETPVSARLDGGDNLWYVVGYRATRIAIEKARKAGIAVVGADRTWYTGMLSYYAEVAAAEGLVTMIASNASPWVAPHGATEGRFGTNPICFGFPSTTDPIIWDIGTSTIMHAEVLLAGREGRQLPENVAFGPDGQATRDPAQALAGAFAPWGGHKGSGLGIVVQLLGILAGSPVLPPDVADFGFLIITLKPDLMMPEAEYRLKVTEYADAVRSARPVPGGAQVRMPFDRSVAERRRRLERGTIKVSDSVLERLRDVAGRAA